MTKKLTRQEKYNKKMTDSGFIRPRVWVHVDDWEKVKEDLEKLRLKRMKRLKVNT